MRLNRDGRIGAVRATGIGFHLPALLLVPLCVALAIPIEQTVQFDPDEGMVLARAAAHAAGHRLYFDVWCDQPPLFLMILGFAGSSSGESVLASRLLVVGFSSLLVWALADSVRLCHGARAGLIAAVLLIVSVNYLRLSASVMIGLPALALTLVSVNLVVRHRRAAGAALPFFAGGLFALALSVKLFVLPILPALALALFRPSAAKPWLQWLTAIAAGLLGLVLGWLLVSLAFGALLSPVGLLEAHRSGEIKSVFAGAGGLRETAALYLQNLDLLLLAIYALASSAPGSRLRLGLPLVWLACVTGALLIHSPIWYHHILLISVPLAWVAAVGADRALARISQAGLRRAAALALLGFVGLASVTKLIGLAHFLEDLAADSARQRALMARIEMDAPEGGWLLTDLPMLAIRAGLSVPPPVATLSRKRLVSEPPVPAMLEAAVARYRPRQILFLRFPHLADSITAALARDYVEAPMVGARYFLRLDDHSPAVSGPGSHR